MLISGHETRSMLERYNIVSLKNVQDAGAKLDAWSKDRQIHCYRLGICYHIYYPALKRPPMVEGVYTRNH